MRKLVLLFAGIILSLTPFIVSAHGSNYLEFNPDYFKTKSLNVSTAGNVYEIFLPVNEFFGGFDFWFDNAGSSGLATFELRDNNNSLIATRYVTIPHINPVSGGQRVHVDLNSQIPVIGSNKYKIKISSSLPQLQLYYSDRVKFLGHNEPHISDYVNGVAEINGEEQQFSFKYGLYEISETSAPIVINIGWSVVSETEMRVEFNTNEATDYRIEYGPAGQGYNQSTNFLGGFEFCTQGISTCSINLSVTPDGDYDFRLTVKDAWNNQSQVVGTFSSGQSQTPSPTTTPTDSPPEISNLRVAELTNNSVGIAWTTNKIANSNLVISFSSDQITITAESDPTFELEHYLETDPVLGMGVSYTAKIRSSDLSNNETTANLNFTTLVAPTPTPTPSPTQTLPPPTPSVSGSPTPTSSVTTSPSPVQVQSPGVTTSTISGGSGTVEWSAPGGGEPSDGYRVDVFDEGGNVKKSILVPSGTHSAVISELEEGNYTVIVYENDDGVFKKLDKPKQLNAEEPFIKRLLNLWPYLLVVVGLGLVFFWLRFRKSSQKIKQVVS